MKKKILILSGDPNSINSEIIFKAWKKINSSLKERIYFISNIKLLQNQFKKLKYSINVSRVENIDKKIKSDKLKVIDIDLEFKDCFKISDKEAKVFVKKSLNLAHKYGQDKKVSGIINCAIDKKLLSKKNIGVTEYLAFKCSIKDNSEVMLIHNNKLSVSPITTHIDIKQVSKKINISLITKKVETINHWFFHKFKKKPKIAILGLNPHNAEMRKNSEEKKIIIPAILKLKKIGIRLSGPLSADSMFVNEYKNYDIIIGMFHDQVLGPFKTLFKFDAINVTLGLKYLRSSPDHGTAPHLIGKNKADPTSLIKCIKFINKFG
jgi:4-hydroxy-L-threonine phosphate dehydrogenase PdxA